MSISLSAGVPALLIVEGVCADHLYREGSAKASFWEVLFGSRLAAEKRTRVSSLEDGTRRFDVPVAAIEDSIWANAEKWFAAQSDSEALQSARHTLATKGLRLSLVGLQPRGVAVASFQLRIELAAPGAPSPGLVETFQKWFSTEQVRLGAILVPFGFTPRAVEGVSNEVLTTD